MPQWYILKTKPRAEQQVVALMRHKAAENYLPLTRCARNLSRLEPLFPGYLFCRVRIPSVQWVEVRALPGISYVLNAEGVPLPASPDLVDALRERVAQELKGPRPCRFVSGEKVHILSGPMAGLEAAFDRRLTPSGRSRILVNLLARQVPAEIMDTELGPSR